MIINNPTLERLRVRGIQLSVGEGAEASQVLEHLLKEDLVTDGLSLLEVEA